MRLVLVINGLGPGGAERVMTLLADSLVARQHEVTLVTFAPLGGDFFPVDVRVRRVALDMNRESTTIFQMVRANVARVRALRAAIREVKPDAVLSFITSTNVLTMLACFGLAVRRIISERVDPGSHPVGRAWGLLRSVTYRHADVLVVQTASAAAWFEGRVGARCRRLVIPNPVTGPSEALESVEIPKPFLLAAGRLTRQKGFDILIRAFATVADAVGPLSLAIAGEGEEAQPLRRMIAERGLENKVFLLGRVPQLAGLMQHACAFVLSSRYEGLPNVLLEALANGVPVVSTDCPGGAREILCNGEYGLLVPPEDPHALADALVRVATDAELRGRLALLGRAAVEGYAIERVVARWEETLSGGPSLPSTSRDAACDASQRH